MNADRRKRLAALASKLGELHSELEGIRDEEAEYAESVPESMCAKQEKAEETRDQLDEACMYLSDAFDNVNNAQARA